MSSIFGVSGVDDALDKAIAIPSARVRAKVAKLRARHPHASPERIISILEKQFTRASKLSGAGVGAAAAVPAVGTASAVVLTSAQVAAFLAASALHVMAVAEVHGIPTEDTERRRTLLLTALLGEDGASAVQASLGISSVSWAKRALQMLPISTVKSVNTTLRKRAAKKAAAKGGGIAVGRLAPFGIGAVIGWSGGKALARTVIEGTRAAFGPAPTSFASLEENRAATLPEQIEQNA
ncbi:MAG: hypothetical protein Q4P36_06805 [Bowdeniella nasicola]|nr:hypothetical protein [Bowdeniella nasicola]